MPHRQRCRRRLIELPPDVVPDVTFSAVMTGAARLKVNRSAVFTAEVPPAVVTVTSTAPAAFAGETAVMDVAELMTNEAAFTPPNDTAVAPVKFVPVITTDVPPLVDPLVGLNPVTVGAGS